MVEFQFDTLDDSYTSQSHELTYRKRIPCPTLGDTSKADLIAFLERYPERHKISILSPVCRCSKTAFSSMPLSDNARNVMKGYYSHLLHSEKDILRVSDICRIIGYGKTIVNTWFLSGNLKFVVIRGAKHTAKEILSKLSLMTSQNGGD